MRLPIIAAAAFAGTLLGASLGVTAPAGAQSQAPAQAPVPAPAQSQAPAQAPGQTQATTPPKTGCVAGVVNEPTTPKEQNSAGGTAPGNTGNTGFTGAGLGGSFAGTSPNGPVAGSPSFQPATAKGLDPISAPPKASSTGNC